MPGFARHRWPLTRLAILAIVAVGSIALGTLPSGVAAGAPAGTQVGGPPDSSPSDSAPGSGASAGGFPGGGAPASGAALEPGWVMVANHLHSGRLHNAPQAAGIRHIRETCAKFGIADAILTDHNTIAGWFDPSFTATGPVTMIPGEEWTSTEGHANLIGFEATSAAQAILPVSLSGTHVDHAKAIDDAHHHGGLAIINHPVSPKDGWPADTFGADLVEVNRTWSDPEGGHALSWWVARLVSGAIIGAAGGSDYHYIHGVTGEDDACVPPPPPGEPQVDAAWWPQVHKPVMLVKTDAPSVAGIVAGLRARHVQVLSDPTSPRCYVDVDASGDGAPGASMAGDRIRCAPGQHLHIRARIVGGKGKELSIHRIATGPGGSDTATRQTIGSDDWSTTVDVTVALPGHGALFFEVGRLFTLTNPVWF